MLALTCARVCACVCTCVHVSEYRSFVLTTSGQDSGCSHLQGPWQQGGGPQLAPSLAQVSDKSVQLDFCEHQIYRCFSGGQ